jgi:general secretion pathway protein B
MSFILDALRKSEHERQRSTLPGLSQVPLATPPAQLPRWALVVIGVLAAAVLVLGGAWWQSTRAPGETPAAAAAPTIERSVELPPPAPALSPPRETSSPLPSQSTAPLLSSRESGAPTRETALAAAAPSTDDVEPAFDAAPADLPVLPSPAALAAEGIALPTLRLELHAFSEQRRDRFVFINGRKYIEGERLVEGPQLVSIEQRGAVLVQAGQRFLLAPE